MLFGSALIPFSVAFIEYLSLIYLPLVFCRLCDEWFAIGIVLTHSYDARSVGTSIYLNTVKDFHRWLN